MRVFLHQLQCAGNQLRGRRLSAASGEGVIGGDYYSPSHVAGLGVEVEGPAQARYGIVPLVQLKRGQLAPANTE